MKHRIGPNQPWARPRKGIPCGHPDADLKDGLGCAGYRSIVGAPATISCRATDLRSGGRAVIRCRAQAHRSFRHLVSRMRFTDPVSTLATPNSIPPERARRPPCLKAVGLERWYVPPFRADCRRSACEGHVLAPRRARQPR